MHRRDLYLTAPLSDTSLVMEELSVLLKVWGLRIVGITLLVMAGTALLTQRAVPVLLVGIVTSYGLGAGVVAWGTLRGALQRWRQRVERDDPGL